MNHAVVTGATSFIGQHLIRQLLRQNTKIDCVCRPGSQGLWKLPQHPQIRVIELDLADFSRIGTMIDGTVDAIYHLAWEGTRKPYRDDADIQRKNYEAACQVFRASLDLGAEVFVGAGSQAEYGKTDGSVDETIAISPNTEYGKYKAKTYEALLNASIGSGCRLIWPRIFSLYGPGDFPGTLIMSAIDSMLRHETMNFTACTQAWDYLFIEDAAHALLALCSKQIPDGVYNIASGHSRSLREFILEIKEITNSQSCLNFGAIPYGPEGIVQLCPIVDKLQAATGWAATTSFHQGIHCILADRNDS